MNTQSEILSNLASDLERNRDAQHMWLLVITFTFIFSTVIVFFSPFPIFASALLPIAFAAFYCKFTESKEHTKIVKKINDVVTTAVVKGQSHATK